MYMEFRARACARAAAAMAVLACCVVGQTSLGDKRDFEVWHNVPFLQGHGPGYDALETPWRVRHHGRSPGTTRTSASARLPVYVADAGTSSETIHDHTWGSQYRPRANFDRCTSADGPRCLGLAEQYQNLKASSVRRTAGKGGGSLPAGKGHGSSAIVQLFREYRRVQPPLSSGATRQLPDDFRLLGLSSSDGAGSRQLPFTLEPPWEDHSYNLQLKGFARGLASTPGPTGEYRQLHPLITPPKAARTAPGAGRPPPPPLPPRPPPPPPSRKTPQLRKQPPPPPAPPPRRPSATVPNAATAKRYGWSSNNAVGQNALKRLNGHFSVQPPQNGWHKVTIQNGIWKNDDGVQWGIEAILPPGANQAGANPAIRYVAAQDCIYWQQGQCKSKSWAEDCELKVFGNGTHGVAHIRWLGEIYVREA